MQKAVASAKETAANVTAKVEEKLDKTKASVAEKGEKVTAQDKTEKAIAHERKEAKEDEAKMHAHEKKAQNVADARATKQAVGSNPTATANTAIPPHGGGRTPESDGVADTTGVHDAADGNVPATTGAANRGVDQSTGLSHGAPTR